MVRYHFTLSPDFPESQRGHAAHLLTSLPLELREFSPDSGPDCQLSFSPPTYYTLMGEEEEEEVNTGRERSE